MGETTIECIREYRRFEALRDEWDGFMARWFPHNYCRTHSWLSAWWRTYHADRPALVYVERGPGGELVAAAPLLVRRENFGGFPVSMLRSLGTGLGSDDFLIGPESRTGAKAFVNHVATREEWHIASFSRLTSPDICGEFVTLGGNAEIMETEDHLVALPDSWEAYLRSRSSKFRNNLLNGTKRVEAEGAISVEVLGPSAVDRALLLCGEVARASWQYQAGKSHFNRKGTPSFYEHLADRQHWTGGEEFVVLLCGGRPAAYLLGCRRGTRYYLVDTAYHPDFRHVSVGRVILARLIERLIGLGGIEIFDLEGTGEYKDYYSTDRRRVRHMTLFRNRMYPQCIRGLRTTRLYRTIRNWKQTK